MIITLICSGVCISVRTTQNQGDACWHGQVYLSMHIYTRRHTTNPVNNTGNISNTSLIIDTCR